MFANNNIYKGHSAVQFAVFGVGYHTSNASIYLLWRHAPVPYHYCNLQGSTDKIHFLIIPSTLRPLCPLVFYFKGVPHYWKLQQLGITLGISLRSCLHGRRFFPAGPKRKYFQTRAPGSAAKRAPVPVAFSDEKKSTTSPPVDSGGLMSTSN